MRRLLLVFTVALVMAAMLMATTLPAFAQASENAGCVGQAVSTAATNAPPGSVGNTLKTANKMRPPGSNGDAFRKQAHQPRDDCPGFTVIPRP